MYELTTILPSHMTSRSRPPPCWITTCLQQEQAVTLRDMQRATQRLARKLTRCTCALKSSSGKMESLNQFASKSQSQKHLKMVNFCAIVGCANRGDRDKGKSFYRLPAVIHNQGAATEELSKKRRDLWLSRISRSDISKSTLPCIRVCSDHFITGLLII